LTIQLEALTDHSWLLDTKGARTVGVIVDFLHLWEVLYNFELEPDVEVSTFGGYQIVGNTLPSLLMRVSSWDLLSLDLMRGFGDPGHRPSVVFSYGWWPIIGAGQLIASATWAASS
jgi:hypothetical protein